MKRFQTEYVNKTLLIDLSIYERCIRQEERERAQKIIEDLDTSGGYYTDSELSKWKQEALKKLNSNE